MNKMVFQLLVDNTSGVLSRISGLFARRGYSIESITAGVTYDPRFSRITIVASGDDEVLEQIEKQVAKLVDVRSVKILEPSSSVYREVCLIKVEASPATRDSIIAISNVFRANIVDVTTKSLIIEILGDTSKIEAFIELLEGHKIMEIARTGITGLSRGVDDVVWLDK